LSGQAELPLFDGVIADVPFVRPGEHAGACYAPLDGDGELAVQELGMRGFSGPVFYVVA
jgi:hypothetical protein